MIKQARDWAGQVQLYQIGNGANDQRQLAPPERVREVPCKMLWTELTVLWDGAVVPCVNFFERHNVLGDLASQTIAEVWNGEPIQRMRRAHALNDVSSIPVCNTCPRHDLDHADFVSVDQLTQRLRNYVRTDAADLTPLPGLS